MIAIDTSSFIAYLGGMPGSDVEVTDLALAHHQAVLPPAVLSELLSHPELARDVKSLLVGLPMLEVLEGYWQRAGLLRASVRTAGRRARLADSLIAQSCLDHDVELVTRDRDFDHLARLIGLRLFGSPVPRRGR